MKQLELMSHDIEIHFMKLTWIFSDFPTGVPGSKPSTKNHQDESKVPEPMSHEIKDHLALLHKERRDLHPDVVQANRIKELRSIHRKL